MQFSKVLSDFQLTKHEQTNAVHTAPQTYAQNRRAAYRRLDSAPAMCKTY